MDGGRGGGSAGHTSPPGRSSGDTAGTAGDDPVVVSLQGDVVHEEAWKTLLHSTLEAFSLWMAGAFCRPSMTMGVWLPASFFAGRFGLISTPVGVVFFAGLMGLAYVSHNKHKKTALIREESEQELLMGEGLTAPLWTDPVASGTGDNRQALRSRAESVEWLNQFVRRIWLRYPGWVGDWLIRDVILGEILESLRRDKVLPAGPIKDIQCTKVILRDAAPWVMHAEVAPSRSLDELVLTARVRFVSDKDAGVELKIKGPAGIILPVKIEQISVETTLCLRFYLQEELPFIRVIWISMTERPMLDLAVLPMGGVDIMHIPGLDTMIHDIIMKGIQREIVLPAGKVIVLTHKMQDDYYKEWGPLPTPLDDYVGEIILVISQTKMMLHPSFREHAAQDLYVRVALDGEQVQRSHKIANVMSEKGNFRFVLNVPRCQPGSGSRIDLHLVCAERSTKHEPVALGSILVNDVVLEQKFIDATWLGVDALTNGAVQVRCTYQAFAHCFKTIQSQHSNMKEFCGGKSDWRPPGAAGDSAALESRVAQSAADFAKMRASTRLSSRAPPGASAPAASAVATGQEELRPNWHEMLPRRQYREALWVTVHGASNLISKMIGTRDPYVRLVVGDQAEKTSAKLNTTNPKWEETMCFFLTDTAVNDELTATVHQDDVSRGYHVVDDAIGSYAWSIRHLKTACNGAWSGVVGLRKVRHGKVSLTMSMTSLSDAVAAGKQREGSGLSDVVIEGCGGIAESIPLPQAVAGVQAIVQVKVLRAQCRVYDSKKKSYDRVPNPYLKVAVGSGNTWQSCDTRVVRSTTAPEFNEYLEFLVRNVKRDQVAFSMETRDGFFTDILASKRVPMLAVARGDVLQRWVPFKGEGAHKVSVLLEMRVSFLEWPGQDPPASQHWKGLFEAKQREREEQASRAAAAAKADTSVDSLTSVGEADDSDWALLVDASKEGGEKEEIGDVNAGGPFSTVREAGGALEDLTEADAGASWRGDDAEAGQEQGEGPQGRWDGVCQGGAEEAKDKDA